MEKIKVLYIIDEFVGLSGAERNLYEVASRLDRNKYQPFVFTLKSSPELLRQLNSKGVFTKDINIQKIYGPKGIAEAFKLWGFIKREKIKIVVTYHESSDFWGGITAWLAGVPVKISSRRDMGYQLEKKHFILYRFLNKLFDRVQAVSDAVRDIIHKRESVPFYKIKTLYGGTDTKVWQEPVDIKAVKESLGIFDDKPVVTTLAGLRPVKEHETFIRAAEIVLRSFPGAHFLIVGWFEESGSYEQGLIKLVKELGIESSVRFIGWRDDKVNIVKATDIPVLCSSSEGFSNSILEYMAASKPVAATNTGGNPEAVEDSRTGWLFPCKDYEALASAVLKLLKDAPLRSAFGSAGRARIEADFTFDVMIKNIECFYEQLLEIKTGGSRRWFAGLGVVKLFRAVAGKVVYRAKIDFMIRKKIKNKNRVIFLAYHSINDSPFDPLGLSISPRIFEAQIKHLKRSYNPVSYEKAINILSGREKAEGRPVVLTFDDGYKDNFTEAYPILKSYGVPAMIFLSAGLISSGSILWYNRVVEYFRLTKKMEVDLSGFNMKKYKLSALSAKYFAAMDVVHNAKYMDRKRRADLISFLESALGFEGAGLHHRRFSMLDWHDIKKMKHNRISFGSHGVNHDILTQLKIDDAEYEISESAKIIEKNTGFRPKVFCYPNGEAADFDAEIIGLIKKHGYDSACTLIRGDYNGDLFSIKRYCVTRGMVTGVFGCYSPRLFESSVSCV